MVSFYLIIMIIDIILYSIVPSLFSSPRLGLSGSMVDMYERTNHLTGRGFDLITVTWERSRFYGPLPLLILMGGCALGLPIGRLPPVSLLE